MDEEESHEGNVLSKNSSLFEGFDRLYSCVVDIEDQLLLEEMQSKAGVTYDDLKIYFQWLQKQVRRVALDVKHRKMKDSTQMTVQDMFGH
jgi:hypothetical protein